MLLSQWTWCLNVFSTQAENPVYLYNLQVHTLAQNLSNYWPLKIHISQVVVNASSCFTSIYYHLADWHVLTGWSGGLKFFWLHSCHICEQPPSRVQGGKEDHVYGSILSCALIHCIICFLSWLVNCLKSEMYFILFFLQDSFGQQHVVEVLKEEMEQGRSATCF